MKKRLVDILNGIADGVFPTVKHSLKKTPTGTEINRARLTASVGSWLLMIAMFKGWLTFEHFAELLKLILTID